MTANDVKITQQQGITDDTPWSPPSQRETTEVILEKPRHQADKNPALKPLTRKQRVFTEYLINNPKASATTAAKAAYNVTTEGSARIQAHDTLTKPNVQLELARHSATAELSLLEVLEYSKQYGRDQSGRGEQGASYAGVAVSVAKDILDRVHGKAKQRTEVETRAVTLNIDLSGTLDGNN